MRDLACSTVALMTQSSLLLLGEPGQRNHVEGIFFLATPLGLTASKGVTAKNLMRRCSPFWSRSRYAIGSLPNLQRYIIILLFLHSVCNLLQIHNQHGQLRPTDKTTIVQNKVVDKFPGMRFLNRYLTSIFMTSEKAASLLRKKKCGGSSKMFLG